MSTQIAWTDETWNPSLGCRRVSSGCTRCYAERVAHKMASNPDPKITAAYEGLTQIINGRPAWTGVFRELPERLDKPLRWRTPRRVFVNSMSDVFGEGISDAFIWRIFAVMGAAPQHQFQVLTKRPERARSLLGSRAALDLTAGAAEDICAERGWCHMGEDDFTWPLANVWLGTSVEDQQTADTRIPLLLQTPAKIRFISAEPLLGPLDLGSLRPSRHIRLDALNGGGINEHGVCQSIPNLHTPSLDWVIVGSESGPGARPMDLDWVRQIRDQCEAAGVALFLKQFSTPSGRKIHTPELDGRRWMEYPVTGGTP